MPTTRRPRAGSLQYWPRKRAKKAYAKVRTFPVIEKPQLLAFAGYKVGMTHIIVIENNKTSPNKGEEVFIPVTILECPAMKIAGIRAYKKTVYGLKLVKEIPNKVDKTLARKLTLPKKQVAANLSDLKPEEYVKIRVIVYTQPNKTGLEKKKPELFEVDIGGSVEDQIAYVKEKINKEILLQEVFSQAELVDVHAITKGKGFQGTTKRYGTSIRGRKSEKHKRGAANLGAWTPAKVLYTQPQPGKMGYHQRSEYNKWILKISSDTEEINKEGGYHKYGKVRNPYILLKGSIPGPKKRLIICKKPVRPKKVPNEAPSIIYLSLESKQGR